MRKFNKESCNVLLIPVKIILVIFIFYSSFIFLKDVFLTRGVANTREFNTLKPNTLDVLVVGSSMSQYSFNPGFFYQDTGLRSYVLGSQCQPIEATYNIIKEALKTQRPKMIIYEVHTALPLKSICMEDSSYIAAHYLMSGQEKLDTINYLDHDKAKEFYNDFNNNHNDWKYFESLEDFIKVPEYNLVETGFGYKYQKQTLASNKWFAKEYEVGNEQLDEYAKTYLDKIRILCEEQGIELLLYKTPVDGFETENATQLQRIWEYAESYGISYVDFFEIDEMLNYKMWIDSDSYHSYVTGANIITRKLANKVNEYQINYSEDIDMDKAYDIFANRTTMYLLDNERDPFKYLDRTKHFSGYTIVRYNEGNKISKELKDKLTESNIYINENENLFALLLDGQGILKNNDFSNIEYENNIISYRDNTIFVNDIPMDDKGGLTLLFTDDFEKIAVKNINLTTNWEYGYNGYVLE